VQFVAARILQLNPVLGVEGVRLEIRISPVEPAKRHWTIPALGSE